MRMEQRKKAVIPAAWLLLICLVLAACPLSALADGYATYGSAQGDTSFYVSAAGPAAITLSQNGTGLAEKQYIYNTANTASEYVYAQYTVLYRGSLDTTWQQAAYWNSEMCTVNFPRADTYMVRVLPTSIQNMQTGQTGWRYTRWINVPNWYVSGVRNCTASSNGSIVQPTAAPWPTAVPWPTAAPAPTQPAGVPVVLEYWDVRGGDGPMARDVQYMTPGVHPVQTARTFDYYTLVGITSSVVSVSTAGTANPATVYLLYRYTGGVVPQTTTPPNRRAVKPVAWDTQYKPGASAINEKRYQDLPNLYDDNRATTFKWKIVESEWKDSIPEITAYFNGSTVGAIGIRNGDCSSERNFLRNCRATQWRIRVWSRSGQYQDTLFDMATAYYANYQVKVLSQQYTDVDRIELFLVRYDQGQTNTDGIYLSDIRFYTE